MNDQTPRPESGAGHDVPAAFSSHTSVPAGAPSGDPAFASTAPTEPIPPGATAPLGAPYGTAAGGASFGPAAQHEPVASAAAKEKRSVGGATIAAMVIAAALVGGVAGFGTSALGGAFAVQSSSSPAAGPSTVTVNNTESVSAATGVAAKVVPSVVTIQVQGGSSGGSGSGVVLDKQGHILTNAHVVTLDGAASNPTIRVTTSDGRILNATVVGIDATYDLAVIKVEDGSSLTPIEFADSSKVNVGAQTIAVGAPLGLSNSVTTGIVSALNRSIQIQSSAAPDNGSDQSQQSPNQESPDQQPFQFDIPGRGQQSSGAKAQISISVIQTDAAINPGNSGGALVDGTGKLIGINVAIASAGSSQSGEQSGNIGVGFAIPSDIAKRVSSELIDKGKATHGLLGASVLDADKVQGAQVVGAAIQKVEGGGAAEAAGLKAGDIVTQFNGTPITSASDLTAQVRAAAAGSKAEVTYVRDGRSQTATATLGAMGS